jgi:hypothetical protein
VREIVRLFSNRETQDEMGGRRIVVALNDALFPGTSVLHSRARYLIFIPWFIQRSTTSKHPLRQMEGFERAMIQAFLDADSVPDEDRTEGLIGNRAGPKVKQLPSTAYWTALEKWGILEWPGNLASTIERSRRLRATSTSDELDELADRSARVWHHGLEALLSEIPREFPDSSDCAPAHGSSSAGASL